MTVLDASVLIAHLDERDAHHGTALRLLTGLADEEFLIHPLTLAELLVGPTRIGRQPAATATFDARLASAARDLGITVVS